MKVFSLLIIGYLLKLIDHDWDPGQKKLIDANPDLRHQKATDPPQDPEHCSKKLPVFYRRKGTL
jgi:hypothetical protein